MGNWWALALRATAALLLGIIAFTVPGLTLVALVVLFGSYAIIDGVLALVAAVRGLRAHERWWPMLLEGVAGIAVGIAVLLWPAIGALTLAYLVATWALVTGALQIATGVRLRHVLTREWLLILGGVLSVLLGALIAFLPGVGVAVIVLWLGAYALVYGAVSLVQALRLRQHVPLGL